MNIKEAQELWMRGKKVRHTSWWKGSYVYRNSGGICLGVDGLPASSSLFSDWNPSDGWEEYVEPKPEPETEEEEIEEWDRLAYGFSHVEYRDKNGKTFRPEECKEDIRFRGFVFRFPDGRERLSNDFRAWIDYRKEMSSGLEPLNPCIGARMLIANAVRMAKAK